MHYRVKINNSYIVFQSFVQNCNRINLFLFLFLPRYNIIIYCIINDRNFIFIKNNIIFYIQLQFFFLSNQLTREFNIYKKKKVYSIKKISIC